MANKMNKKEFFIVDEEEVLQQNRSARRRARIKSIGQDRFLPKKEKSKTRYTRKVKHKGIDDEY